MYYSTLLYSLSILLHSILSQDILFPTSSQDSPELSQIFPIPNISYSPQAFQSMVDYQHPIGSSNQGINSAVGGSSGGGYGGDIPGGVMDLGMAIHRITRNQGDENWVYSPTSIASALYLVLLGANGNTFTELSKLLGIYSLPSSLKPHEDYTLLLRYLEYTGHENNILKLANGLFVQNDYSIRQDYRDLANSLYQSSIFSLDFRNNGAQSRDFINSWVSEKTQGKITKLLSEPPIPETKIVLTSSLYFKGEWAIPFPTELTKMQNFYPNGRYQPAAKKVPMMATQSTFRYYHDQNLNCEVVGMPYKGESIVFYLVLPENSNKEQLKSLENKLNHTEFQRLSEHAIPTYNVIVALPKMKLSSKYVLNSVLQELGVRELFDPLAADMSLLSSPENSPSTVEEEDSLIFTRIMKPNVTERKKRFVEASPEDLVKQKRQVNDRTSSRMSPNLEEPKKLVKRQIQMPKSSQTNNILDSSRLLGNLVNPGLYVNQILHKIVVDLNEKGTEAAATTSISIAKTVSHTVKADVPFLFYIRHETSKLVLFWGSVTLP